MALQTVTIDFWNTLVIARSNGKARQSARIRAVQELGGRYHKTLSGKQVEDARSHADTYFRSEWLGRQYTPTTRELVSAMLEYLNIPASDDEIDRLREVFQSSLLDGPPELAPAVPTVVPELASRYYLMLISDTMFTPGRILREYLRLKNLYDCFYGCVFSDEAGVSKPHPEMFKKALAATGSRPEQAVHIGDLQQTDVEGARNMGMKSILYTGVNDDDRERTTADFVCENWREIPDILKSL